jgi:hypothetical protein
MTPPINIDGSQVSEVTIDGQPVSQVTIDGQDVLSAIPDSVVDSFEDGNIGEYGGDTGAFSVISSDATDGQNALKLDNATTGGRGSLDGISSTSGLDDYPERGDIFRCDWQPTQDIIGSVNRLTIAFATQGESESSDCYAVAINPGISEFGIGDGRISGAANLVSEQLGSLSSNTQYYIEVEWGSATNNDSITARLVETGTGTVINEVSVQDGRLDNGGVGFGVNQGSGNPEYVVDFYRLQNENAV